MSPRSIWRKGALFLACAVIAFGASFVRAQTQIAVEYYYGAWNNYFVTSFPDEIAVLDAGAFGGVWKRTGQTFNVWAGPTSGALATCRFFSTTFAPKSSHFYTPYETECSGLMSNPNWQFEATAFYVQLPDANGKCPAGTVVLYRLYNNGMGGSPNHRFITSASQFNQMRAAGWTFEGNGITGAFACVPPGPPAPLTAEGRWQGRTSDGGFVLGIVLDTGEYYFLYYYPPSDLITGFVQGTSSSVTGNFSSADARDVHFGGGVIPVSFTGNYTAQSSLSVTVHEGTANTVFQTSYVSSYTEPVALASYAGSYSSTATNAFTVDAFGSFTGVIGECTFAGSAVPHGGVAVLNLILTASEAMCVLDGQTMTGIAFFGDDAHTQLFIVVINADGSYLYFVGSRQG